MSKQKLTSEKPRLNMSIASSLVLSGVKKSNAKIVCILLAVQVLPVWAQNRANEVTGSASLPFLTKVESQRMMGDISIEFGKKSGIANGVDSIPVTISLHPKLGVPLPANAWVHVSVNHGKLLTKDAKSDPGINLPEQDRLVGGELVKLVNGKATLQWLAPANPVVAKFQVQQGSITLATEFDFLPDVRELIALGLIEGVLRLPRSSHMASDESGIKLVGGGFDSELKAFEQSFSSGKLTAAGRMAFFIKGGISGQTLLTARYDTDKPLETSSALAVKPEQLYPIMGDASTMQNHAVSAGKLFVRLDNGKNYLLWGDFQTQDAQTANTGNLPAWQQRELGVYRRQLSGLKGQAQTEQARGSFFAAEQNTRWQVEEIAAHGGSFYSVTSKDMVDGSERVEIWVRDRQFPTRVLQKRSLQRLSEFSLDPLSQRLLLKDPLSRFDSNGNLQYLHLTYEVREGAKKNWVAGAELQARLGPNVQVGFAAAKELQKQTAIATGTPEQLLGASAQINLPGDLRVSAELAQSRHSNDAGDDLEGQAARIQIGLGQGQASSPVKAALTYQQADINFYQPQSSVAPGYQQLNLILETKLSDRLLLEARSDALKDVEKDRYKQVNAIQVTAEWAKDLKFIAGVRQIKDTGIGQSQFAQPAIIPIFADIKSADKPATQDIKTLESMSIYLKAEKELSPKITLAAEAEKSVTGDIGQRFAARVDYKILPNVQLRSRYEWGEGLSFGGPEGQSQSYWAFGLSQQFSSSILGRGDWYSELRQDPAGLVSSGSQWVNGVRTAVPIGESWRAVAALEQTRTLNSLNEHSSSVAAGLEYAGSGPWRGSTRLEWRQVDNNTPQAGEQWTHNISLSRRLSQDWTALIRHYWAHSDRAQIPGQQAQQRFALGMAYRDSKGQWDSLAKVEWHKDRQSESQQTTQREATVGSLHMNWHPSKPVWVSTRLAAKTVKESNGQEAERFSAALVGLRATYDINNSLDVTAMAHQLSGQGKKSQSYGVEVGYALATNLYLGLGYNWAGFVDKDLTAGAHTQKGIFMRLRYKFDEQLLAAPLNKLRAE